MEAIYVISSDLVKDNNYKIGMCKGDKDKLTRRYNTYFVDSEIELFYPCPNNSRAENFIHMILDQYRLRRKNGTLSEWFRCDIETIKNAFDSLTLVGNPLCIGYHNYKELKVRNCNLIGKQISSIMTEESIAKLYRRTEKESYNVELAKERYNEDFKLLRANINNKQDNNAVFSKVKGRFYSFTTNDIFPLLNSNLLEDIFPELKVTEIVREKLYSDSEAISKALTEDYYVPSTYSECFRRKDNRLFFTIAILFKDIRKIAKVLLNKEDIVIPREFNCDKCDFHTDHPTNYDNHLKTQSCQRNHGFIISKVKKAKALHWCRECNKSFKYPSKLEEHRDSDKCKIKRGVIVVEKTKYHCNLCGKTFAYQSKYDAHRNSTKCLKKQRAAGEIE